MVRNRHAESVEEAARQKQNARGSKMKKQVEVNAIHRSIKNAKKYLHRTQDPQNPHRHRQLCVSYVIDSSLARKEYANLQKIRFLHTVKGSLLKVMNRFMRPLYTQR